jgi:demethoxyubiquinone hydroxylase (CLK1/Coq7/Cat5 family)
MGTNLAPRSLGVGKTRLVPSTDPADITRYRVNRQGEIDSAAVYRAMARAEKNAQLASVYTRLAQVEERHLAFWEEQLRAGRPGRL